MKRILSALTAFLILIPVTGLTEDLPPPSPQECTNRMQSELTAVHDTYRSVLFGSRKTASGLLEVLTGGLTDEERTGIFETKRRLTSELVAPLIESYRVYRCKSLGVCAMVTDSFVQKGGDANIHLLGCSAFSAPRYEQCYLGTDEKSAGSPAELTSLVSQCQVILEQTFRAEESVLRLAVAYDAGYRSLLQMAGMMDWMLEGFPTLALKAISTMVNMLGKLTQIPCYIGQCDNPRSDYLKP
jgi:hypothetical protein